RAHRPARLEQHPGEPEARHPACTGRLTTDPSATGPLSVGAAASSFPAGRSARANLDVARAVQHFDLGSRPRGIEGRAALAANPDWAFIVPRIGGLAAVALA